MGAPSLFRSRSIAVVAAIVMFHLESPALASVPAPVHTSDQYIITRYGPDDGLYADVVDRIQRTPDGFLWLIVNGKGLARFDGRNFDLLLPHGVTALTVAPTGDLWIGMTDGLRRVPLRSLPYFDLADADSIGPAPEPAKQIISLRSDPDSTLWVGTDDGLFRFRDGRFEPLGPRVGVREIEQTATGHLLLITANGFAELDQAKALPLSGLTEQLGARLDEVFHVMESSDGDTWYCTGRGVVRRSAAGWQKLPGYGEEGNGAYRSYEDGKGNVWVAKAEGLFHATTTGLEAVIPKIHVRFLYGDPDGTLWVGTNGEGLLRLKERRARVFTTADGLPNDVIMTVIAAQDGSVWAGANCGGLIHFDGTHFRTYNEHDGLLNSCVWALAEDANLGLWIGTWGGGVFRLFNERFTQFLDGEIVTSIAAAQDGSIWCSTRNGVAQVRREGVRMYTTADGLPYNSSNKLYEDRTGRILVGSRGGVHVLVGDRFEVLTNVGNVSSELVGETRSGDLFIGFPAEEFALRIRGQGVDTLPNFSQPEALVEMSSGELWFGGVQIHRVPPSGLVLPQSQDEPLDNEVFGTGDGLPAPRTSAGHPTIALAADGTIWAATPSGLAAFDPSRAPWTTDPPTIYVRGVTVGRTSGPAPRDLSLPPGTSHVEIDFAAVETSSPEKIHMQYRLDGVDRQWLDVGTDARAIYSNIPAGKHALRLRSSNRNGIWNRDGVTYSVSQRPYFYQTRWFLAVAIMSGLAVVALAHRIRVRQVARQLAARFDERLAERTRVARDLHDTFLQTVQGSKLVAEGALHDRRDPERLAGAMEQLAGWLTQATEEARAALNSLRTSAIETNNLRDALEHAAEECRAQANHLEAKVSSAGEPKEIHPIVRDEVYRIGCEAIRNACTHSDGHVLTVLLEYGSDLALRVIDDGVGMTHVLSVGGKEGHFGLGGMRERAERIGARLTVTSSPGSGTAITLIVPGRVAYQTRGPLRL